MAKNKKPLIEPTAPSVVETQVETPVETPVGVPREPDEVTVENITQAEGLQKSGWQLIDCHQTPKGKTYKFRKVK